MTLRVGVNLLWCVPGAVGGSEEYLARQLGRPLDAPSPTVDVTLFALRGLRRRPSRPGGALPDRDGADRRAPPQRAGRRRAHVAAGAARERRLPLAPPRRRHDARGPSRRRWCSPSTTSSTSPTRSSSTRLKLACLASAVPSSVGRAAVVTVPSEFVKGTVVDAFAYPAERIVVVPHGLDRAGERRPDDVRSTATTWPAVRAVPGDHPPAQEPRDPAAGLRRPRPGLRRRAARAARRRRHWRPPRSTAEIDRLGLAAPGCVRPGRVPDADRDGLVPHRHRCWSSPACTRASARPVLEAMAARLPGDRRRRHRPARGGRRRRRARRPDGRRGLDRPPSPACSTTTPSGDRLAAAGRRRARRVHRRRVGTLAPAAPTVSPPVPHETRRPLPPLRSRHRAHRRGHHAHRRGAGRPRPPPRRRDGAAVVRAPPGRGRLGRPAGAHRGHAVGLDHAGPPVPRPTSARSRAGPSPSPASARWPACAGLRGGRADGVLAMSPPLTLGLTGRAWRRRAPGAAGVQHPGRLPRRRHRARCDHQPAGDRRRPAARAGRATGAADAVTVLSDDLRDNVAAKLPAAERAKVRVIPNFVDTEAIVPARPDDGLPPRARHRRRDGRDVRRQRRPLAVARAGAGGGREADAPRGRRVRGERRRLGPSRPGAPGGGHDQRALRRLPAEGAPRRGAGHRRRPRRAAEAGPGPLERAVQDVLDPRRRPAARGQRRPRHRGGARRRAGGQRRRRRARRSGGLPRRRGRPRRRSRTGGAGWAPPGGRSWSDGRRRRPSPRAYEALFSELARHAIGADPPGSVRASVGKASSNKKVARAARAGGRRKVRGQRGLVFPIAMVLVAVARAAC